MNGSCARISPKAVPSPRCSSRANTCSAMQLTDALREAVIATAREAAAEILRVYDTCFDVDHKADDNPLTAADLAPHRCLVDRPEALTPAIPRLSATTTRKRGGWGQRAEVRV